MHTHSKTCRKYKNLACRFNFGHSFTEKTTVAEPLLTSMDKSEKNRVFKNRECILMKVKKFIDEFLNPSDKQTGQLTMCYIIFILRKVNITIVFQ